MSGLLALGRVIRLASLLVLGEVAPPVYTVALDPGHGGTNLGAQGVVPGLREKALTLDLARRVQRRLAKESDIRLVLCRDKDVMVPVRARVRCGNEAHAQLFLSLHANASPEGPSRGTQRGFEIYVLPVADVDRDAALVAHLAPDEAEAAWASYQVRNAVPVAVESARRIAWRLRDVLGNDKDRGVKQEGAALDVLQGLRVPGVLVEVGFLDHPEEGKFLASEAGREAIATALAEGIKDLRARNKRAKTDPAITSRPRPGER